MALAYRSIHNTVGPNSGARAIALATSMSVAVGLLSMLSTTPQRAVMTMRRAVPRMPCAPCLKAMLTQYQLSSKLSTGRRFTEMIL